VGDKDQDYARLQAPISLNHRPSPPHSEMIDDDRIPIARHLLPERATERCGIILGRNIRKAAEQAPHRKTPAYFSIAFPGDHDPFDPVVAGAAGALVSTAHCQDRESHASAAEARQKIEAVCQVSGIRRHRIHAREPEAPQRARSDLGEIMHRFYYYTYSIKESLSIHCN
jgi:hypothetical protein